MKKIISLLLLTCILFSLASCGASNSKKYKTKSTELSFVFFNTVSTITSYGNITEEEFQTYAKKSTELLEKYHRLFDIYYEYSGVNNIKTINENAGISAVKVDKELIDFLVYCKELYTLTNGKTNIMLGSVLRIWHDCREEANKNYGFLTTNKLPSEETLKSANRHTSIDLLVINEEESTVYVSDSSASIDVGAIGKGYATQKLYDMLVSLGVDNMALNIGGNLRTIGTKPGGDKWVTGITNPDSSSKETLICRVKIGDSSLVTSGDYERFFFAGDVKYHHIIDPDTLYPAAYFPSVSIFAKDSGLADALSTALFCMSYEEGKALADSIDGVEVVWITFDGTILHTDGVEFVSK